MSSVTFPEELGGNGQTYTDDADPDTGLDGLGYTVRFIPCLQQAVAMGLSAQSNAEAAAGYVEQCQTLRDEVAADLEASQQAASDAGGSMEMAERWASEGEDTEVSPGLYSAYHWAKKAEAFGDPNEFNFTADLSADTRTGSEWMAQVLANQQASNDNNQALAQHLLAADPHTQYEKKAALKAAAYREVVGGEGALMAEGFGGIGSLSRDLTNAQTVNLKAMARGIYGANRPANDFVEGLPSYVGESEYSSHIPMVLSSPGSSINSVLSFMPTSKRLIWGLGDGTTDPASFIPIQLFHNHNILGPVTSSEGVPTGSLIESGSNDFGEYRIFADGSMEQLLMDQTFTYNSVATLSKTLLLPRSFSGAHRVHIQLAFPSAGSNYTGTINSLSMGNVVYGTTTNSITDDVGVSILRAGSSSDFAPGDQVTGILVLLKGKAF